MTDSTGPAYARMVEALRDPHRLYDGAQLAFFMAAAMRWGYELRTEEEQAPDALSYWAGHDAGYRQRVAEENAAYPPVKVFSAANLRDLADVRDARAAADASREQRYAGGPVPDWGASRPDPDDLGPSGLRWRPGAGLAVRRDGRWAA